MNGVGRLTLDGAHTVYEIPGGIYEGGNVTVGRDGALWVATPERDQFARVTTDGQGTRIPLPDRLATVPGIAFAADGSSCLVDSSNRQIIRFRP